MADIKFVNNLGELVFKRCLISVSDHWEFNGRTAKKSKSISIDGYMNRDEIERVDGLLTDSAALNKDRGALGQLVLPWTVLNNVRVEEVNQGVNTWIDLQQIQATFVDEYPFGNTYTASFFGLILHNPRIGIGLPQGELRDEYPQMSLQSGLVWNPNTVGAGVMRTKGAAGMIEMTMSGAILIEDGRLPLDWQNKLVRRAGMSYDTINSLVPAGWPMPFSMADACPELATSLNYSNMFVSGGRIVWDVEAGMGQVDLEFLCQPQRMV